MLYLFGWFISITDKIVQADPNNENKIVMCKLRHPKAGKSFLYEVHDFECFDN